MLHRIILTWKTNLIKRISLGIGGALLVVLFPKSAIGLLGEIFVGGLKAIALSWFLLL